MWRLLYSDTRKLVKAGEPTQEADRKLDIGINRASLKNIKKGIMKNMRRRVTLFLSPIIYLWIISISLSLLFQRIVLVAHC